MGKIERFEDIEAWQKAREVVKEVYKTCRVQGFRNDYSLTDQIKRSAVSIMANIAEGFARRTNKEFINFLGIAHTSAAELQSHLYVALDQEYISDSDFSKIYNDAEEVSKMVLGCMNYLKNSKLNS